MKRLIITLIAFLTLPGAFAQRRITVNDGLPRNVVYSALPTRGGPVYIGSWDGLFRYDGAEVREVVFTPSPATPVRTVTALAEGPDGRIWMATSLGPAVYDPKTDRMSEVPGPREDVTSLTVSAQGTVAYIVDYDSLYIYTPALDSLHCAGRANTVYRRSDGSLGAVSHSSETARRAFMAANGDLYVSTFAGVVYRKPAGGSFAEIARIPQVRAFAEHNGLILMGHDGGVTAYDPADGALTPVSDERQVMSLAVDAENGVWTGTFYGGITYRPATADNFAATREANSRLLGAVISGVARDARGRLWLAVEDGGLASYDPATQAVENFPGGSRGPFAPTVQNVQTVFADSLTLLVGMAGGGMDVIDLRSGLRRNFGSAQGLPPSVYAFAPTGKPGEYYTGTMAGLFRFAPGSGPAEAVAGIPREIVHSLTPDADGSLWVPTLGAGLFRLDPSGRVDTFRLESDMIMSVCPTDSAVYVGTEGQGLYVLDRSSGESRPMESLPARLMVFRILAQGDAVWFSTNKGLMAWHPARRRLERFTAGDGLPTNQFKINSGIVAGDTLYFGSIDGLVSLVPSELSRSDVRPSVYITDPWPVGEEIELEREDNNISFRFASSSLANPANNRFEYRLEPVQHDWQSVSDPVRSVNFANLPPGNYTFRLRTVSGNGLPSEETSVRIRVLDYWWLRSPMITLYAWLTVMFLMWAGRRIMRKIRRDAEAAARVRAAASALEREFVSRLDEVIDRRMVEADLSVDDMAAELALGRSIFYQRVKEITGQTPNDYLRSKRLEQAAELLREGALPVKEVAYRVGFSSPSYFSRCFSARFGFPPTALRQ